MCVWFDEKLEVVDGILYHSTKVLVLNPGEFGEKHSRSRARSFQVLASFIMMVKSAANAAAASSSTCSKNFSCQKPGPHAELQEDTTQTPLK